MTKTVDVSAKTVQLKTLNWRAVGRNLRHHAEAGKVLTACEQERALATRMISKRRSHFTAVKLLREILFAPGLAQFNLSMANVDASIVSRTLFNAVCE